VRTVEIRSNCVRAYPPAGSPSQEALGDRSEEFRSGEHRDDLPVVDYWDEKDAVMEELGDLRVGEIGPDDGRALRPLRRRLRHRAGRLRIVSDLGLMAILRPELADAEPVGSLYTLHVARRASAKPRT
jgi:hypothetical protein